MQLVVILRGWGLCRMLRVERRCIWAQSTAAAAAGDAAVHAARAAGGK
jgi:hypothetical protein